MALCQPHVAQPGLQALTNDSTVAKPNFINASESVRCHTVPASIDDEYSDTRKRQDRLSAPFLDKLRRHHRKTSERPRASVCEDAAKRNERLSGSTLRDRCSTSGFLPTLDDAHDGHRLGGKRMPLQLLQCRPDGIVWTVQGRKPGKHKLAQRRTICAEVIRNGCQCSHGFQAPFQGIGVSDGTCGSYQTRMEVARDRPTTAGTSGGISIAFRRKP